MNIKGEAKKLLKIALDKYRYQFKNSDIKKIILLFLKMNDGSRCFVATRHLSVAS
jgi:hypothetical protein